MDYLKILKFFSRLFIFQLSPILNGLLLTIFIPRIGCAVDLVLSRRTYEEISQEEMASNINMSQLRSVKRKWIQTIIKKGKPNWQNKCSGFCSFVLDPFIENRAGRNCVQFWSTWDQYLRLYKVDFNTIVALNLKIHDKLTVSIDHQIKYGLP